ncbi:MAG: hypothetical protein OK474_11965 [Thaumarchaeota archaeon]|nr:hypothetical protein [Nitrososphaerota archaeon]
MVLLVFSGASNPGGATQWLQSSVIMAPGTASQTTVDHDVMIQSFFIGEPASCYGSNINCFVNDNGSRIQNVTVTASLDSPLRVTSSLYNGNFSLQINAYSPNGYQPAYMQWVIGCSAQFVPGLMGCYLQAYYVQANDGVLLAQSGIPQYLVVPSPDLTTGTNISISANTNSTGNVVSASGQIELANGTVVFSSLVSLTTFQYGSPNPIVGNAQAPIVGFETQLIGDGNGDAATFTQGSGSLIVKAATPIWSSPSPVGLPYVQYNLPNKGTVEKSNIAYGAYSHPSMVSTSTTSRSIQSNSSQTGGTTSTSSSALTSTAGSSGNSGGGMVNYIVVNRFVLLPFLIVAVSGLLIEGYTIWSRRRRNSNRSEGSR